MLRGISQLFKAISTSLVPMHRTVEADAPWTSAFWLRRDHSVWTTGTQLGSRGERVSLAELGTEFRVWPVQVL